MLRLHQPFAGQERQPFEIFNPKTKPKTNLKCGWGGGSAWVFAIGHWKHNRGTGVARRVQPATQERSIKRWEQSFSGERTLWDLSLLVSLTLWDTPVLLCTPTSPLPIMEEGQICVGGRAVKRLHEFVVSSQTTILAETITN